MKQTAGREKLGNLAPEFARYNDDILFGKVWSREDKLSLHARSLITIAALIGAKNFPQVKDHLQLGKANGITKEEAVEIVTQLAFYTGWPSAWTVFPMIVEVYGNDLDNKKFNPMFGLGKPNEVYAKYFVGKSYLNPLNENGLYLANITFEPGARNNWHIHKATKGGGQILLCTDGKGFYQEDGEKARILMPGDTIYIAPGVKHWHGASKDSWFSHIAIEVPGENTSTCWLEAVSDEEYNNL